MLLAYCGINCEECEAFIAAKNDDIILKEKVANKWSKLYGTKIKPEDINCQGCKSGGQKGHYCEKMCKISKCCIENNFESCAKCESYACKDLQEIFNCFLDAKKRLDCLRE